MGSGGCRAGLDSSCRSVSSHACSAAGSWRSWSLRMSNCGSSARSGTSPTGRPSPITWRRGAKPNGSFTPNDPFAGPEAVLAYLSRYTHRIAIANSRLVAFDDNTVTFKWKDYRAKGRERYKTMTLDAHEFIRRFLIHVLPHGFHRIRHYGLFANGNRADNLARARQLLDAPEQKKEPDTVANDDDTQTLAYSCPCCGGPMVIIETFERGAQPRAPLPGTS